jgi:hypothetical protein
MSWSRTRLRAEVVAAATTGATAKVVVRALSARQAVLSQKNAHRAHLHDPIAVRAPMVPRVANVQLVAMVIRAANVQHAASVRAVEVVTSVRAVPSRHR